MLYSIRASFKSRLSAKALQGFLDFIQDACNLNPFKINSSSSTSSSSKSFFQLLNSRKEEELLRGRIRNIDFKKKIKVHDGHLHGRALMSIKQLYHFRNSDQKKETLGHTQKRRSGTRTIPFPFQEPFITAFLPRIESKPGAESHQEEKFQQIT